MSKDITCKHGVILVDNSGKIYTCTKCAEEFNSNMFKRIYDKAILDKYGKKS